MSITEGLRSFLFALASATLLACGSETPPDIVENPRGIEIRAEIDAAGDGAQRFEFRTGSASDDASELWLGPPEPFTVVRAFKTMDSLGKPALGMDVDPEQADGFRDWTGARVDERMAIVIDGDVFYATTIAGPLTGHLVVRGELEEAEIDSTLEAMRPAEDD